MKKSALGWLAKRSFTAFVIADAVMTLFGKRPKRARKKVKGPAPENRSLDRAPENKAR